MRRKTKVLGGKKGCLVNGGNEAICNYGEILRKRLVIVSFGANGSV